MRRQSRPEILVPQRVTIATADGEGRTDGWIVAISIVGADIHAPDPPPAGSRVELFAGLQDGDVRVCGRVQWSVPGQFGVQFGALGVRETHAIVETSWSGGVSWELRTLAPESVRGARPRDS